jgi:hypothetical protein
LLVGIQTFSASSSLAGKSGWNGRRFDRERRPRRDRGVEEVDREVARDAAVGEPARRRDRGLSGGVALAVHLARPVHAVQRHGAQQHREAEAHARRDHYGQVVGRRQRTQREHRGGIAVARRRRVRLHVRDDALREQRAELVRVEPEGALLPRQPARGPVRHVRGHHLQPQPRAPQLAERERAGALPGQVVDQVREPRRQRRRAAGPRRRAVAEPVAGLGQQPRRAPREERRQPDQQRGEHAHDACDEAPPAQQPAAVEYRQQREHRARREQRRGDERVAHDGGEQRPQRPARRGRAHDRVEPPRAALRLEQVEQVAARADPRRQPGQPLEPAAGAPELRRSGRGRGDRARRRAADALEAVRPRQLADRVRVDHAARDPALHHDVALERRGCVVGPGEVGHGVGSRIAGSIGCTRICIASRARTSRGRWSA